MAKRCRMANKIRKFTLATGTLTLPTEVTSADDIVIQDVSEDNPNVRQKLNKFLNLLSVQTVIVTVVVVDVMLVIFLLLMELDIIQAPPSDGSRSLMKRSIRNSSQSEAPNYTVQQAEHAMHIIELIVLTVFLTEIILRVFARGVDLIYDKWQVFDSLVVIVTFALYVSLTAAVTSRRVTYSVGFFVILRLWRIGRIHYDSTQPIIQKARSLILAHRQAWRETEEQLKQSRQQISRQQEKIDSLKAKLRAYQSVIGLKHSDSSLSTDLESNARHDQNVLDNEDYRNNSQKTNSLFVSVHKKPAFTHEMRSCSLPSTLTLVHLNADSSVSLPSSPRNLSHYHSTAKKIVTHGSSGKIPDLVEHTQGADIYRDPSFREALTLQALALDSSKSHLPQFDWKAKNQCNSSVDNLYQAINHHSTAKVSHHGNWMDNSQTEDGIYNTDQGSRPNSNCSGLIVDSPKYIKNADRGSSERVLTPHHREKSASTGALASPGLSHTLDNEHSSRIGKHQESLCTTLPRRNKNDHRSHNGKHYPQDKSDKAHLITDAKTGQEKADYAFTNPSFSHYLSPEELERIEREEIERVSQIPFDQYGSISHLLREGIPISEL